MSAIEVIEKIKQLPREEQERVFAFVKGLMSDDTLHDGPGVRYMDAGKAKAVSAEIFAEHAALTTIANNGTRHLDLTQWLAQDYEDLSPQQWGGGSKAAMGVAVQAKGKMKRFVKE